MNFETLMEMSDDKHISEVLDDLILEETLELQKEVSEWNALKFKDVIVMVNKYFNLIIPVAMIRDIAMNDLEIAYEIYMDGIGDTCQRDMLIDTILRKMGLRAWPTYGEGNQVMSEFKQKLIDTCSKFGVQYTG